MVAKISVGNSLYGALAYNGEKINEAKGRLLTTNRIYNDGTGTMDIHRAMEDFLALMPVRSKVEKPVVHISLNPHPDDILTDTELQNIAREYLEKMGFGNQPSTAVSLTPLCGGHDIEGPEKPLPKAGSAPARTVLLSSPPTSRMRVPKSGICNSGPPDSPCRGLLPPFTIYRRIAETFNFISTLYLQKLTLYIKK